MEMETATKATLAAGKDIHIKLSSLTQADGSAQFKLGKTATLACVNGPDQVVHHKEIIDKALVEVHFEPRSGQSACSDRQIESFISELCKQTIITTMHPRTCLLINITELHDDGCVLASAINATVLALCDAGVPMKNMVAASTCCVNEKGEIILEPTKDQLMNSSANLTAVIDSGCNQLVSIVSKGAMTSEIMKDAINNISDRTRSLFEIFHESISMR